MKTYKALITPIWVCSFENEVSSTFVELVQEAALVVDLERLVSRPP